jgi:putative protein kinase ArgK-like GTPase of G3E family
VGQVETDIVDSADTTVVVVNPGWGDAIQANKAGLMEIADIFVVNKADRDGARDTVTDLESMLNLSGGHEDGQARWRPPVVSTVGTTGEGVAELADALEAHVAHQRTTGELDRSAFRPTIPSGCARWPWHEWVVSWTTCWPPAGARRCAQRWRGRTPTRVAAASRLIDRLAEQLTDD